MALEILRKSLRPEKVSIKDIPGAGSDQIDQLLLKSIEYADAVRRVAQERTQTQGFIHVGCRGDVCCLRARKCRQEHPIGAATLRRVDALEGRAPQLQHALEHDPMPGLCVEHLGPARESFSGFEKSMLAELSVRKRGLWSLT